MGWIKADGGGQGSLANRQGHQDPVRVASSHPRGDGLYSLRYAFWVVIFRANLLVVVLAFYDTTSGVYSVCFGCPHTKQNRGFSGAFFRLWQQLFSGCVHYFRVSNFGEVLLHDVVILSSPKGYLCCEARFSSSLPSDEN